MNPKEIKQMYYDFQEQFRPIKSVSEKNDLLWIRLIVRRSPLSS